MTINSLDTSNSLGDKVFRELENDILSGKIKTGEHLTESKISKQFNVSRTPVRDAIKTLEQAGLVEIIPNKCAVVLGVSLKDLTDIYTIRTCVEGLASRLACENITQEQLEDLTEVVELQEFYANKENSNHMDDLDSRFHKMIYEYGQNKILMHTLTNYHHIIQRYRQMSFNSKGRLKNAIKEHRDILEAIKKRDSELAEKLTIQHIKNAKNNMLKNIENID